MSITHPDFCTSQSSSWLTHSCPNNKIALINEVSHGANEVNETMCLLWELVMRSCEANWCKLAHGPVEWSHCLVKNNKHTQPEQWDGIYWQLRLIDPCPGLSIEAGHFCFTRPDVIQIQTFLVHRKGLNPIGMPIPAASFPQAFC